MGETTNAMLTTIGQGVTSVITWVGNVITAIFGDSGVMHDLLPAIGIAIAIGVIGFGIRTIKNVVWGY